MSFNSEFRSTQMMIKSFFVIFAIIIAGMFIFRFSRMASGKSMYEITIPSYSNTSPTTYFATQYVEKDGCIIFKDEFGFEQKVCGAYQIQKW